MDGITGPFASMMEGPELHIVEHEEVIEKILNLQQMRS
jgi:hypothetical protein